MSGLNKYTKCNLAQRTSLERRRTYWQSGVLRSGAKVGRMAWLTERWRETLVGVKVVNVHLILEEEVYGS